MLENKERNILTICPSVLQFVINELPWLLLCVVGAGYVLMGFPYGKYVLLLVFILLVYLFYRLCFLRQMRYTFTTEQLKSRSGIFSVKEEYMELYRIYDGTTIRSFMQILFGLKTFIIVGGDKTDPKLPIIGIKNSLDIWGIVRPYIEQQRKERKITEIANR